MPMRLMAAEITREKLFLALRQELPYELTVETENWEDFDDGSVKIEQAIHRRARRRTRKSSSATRRCHDRQGRAEGIAHRARRDYGAAACTSNSSSRCARTGWIRPSTSHVWGLDPKA
jgi:hypothetical protein